MVTYPGGKPSRSVTFLKLAEKNMCSKTLILVSENNVFRPIKQLKLCVFAAVDRIKSKIIKIDKIRNENVLYSIDM